MGHLVHEWIHVTRENGNVYISSGKYHMQRGTANLNVHGSDI